MKHADLRAGVSRFEEFCKRYESVFSRRSQKRHFRAYLEGLLGPLQSKAIEPIALAQRVNVRLLQHFIGASTWDDTFLIKVHQDHVIQNLGDPEAVLILDSTGYPKRGEHSVGVQKQWCGELGKKEICQVGHNLVYASVLGHAFLDRRLYLPEQWCTNSELRDKCNVPQNVRFRTGWQLGLEMIQVAIMRNIPHGWISADEEYGKVPEFHQMLAVLGERYALEVPCHTHVWISGSKWRKRRKHTGLLNLTCGRLRPHRVDRLADMLPQRAWQTYYLRAASKGPLQVRVAPLWVGFQTKQKRPGSPGWLVLTETVDQRAVRKYFEANADIDTPLAHVLAAAYARWPIEQCHRQGKNGAGLGEYQTRSWPGWHHHTAIDFLAHHFLVLERNRLGEKIP